MPKPRVSAESKQYRTKKDNTDWTAQTEGESIGSEQDLNSLSFLYGAACDGGTNDMGPDTNGYGYPGPWGGPGYEARRKLRRHTVEQGMSTWSFPAKK